MLAHFMYLMRRQLRCFRWKADGRGGYSRLRKVEKKVQYSFLWKNRCLEGSTKVTLRRVL